MNLSTYYRDHWVEIDEERLNNYEAMFAWHPRMAPLLDPAQIEAGQSVLDFGCGPGGMAMEVARRVGSSGKVTGVDLNTEMLRRAGQLASSEGLTGRVSFRHVTSETLPFDSGTFDTVLCKSVLEYVDDPAKTISEFARVTRAGGTVHVVDSDWDMLVVSPWTEAELKMLYGAAAHAYRSPRSGRRLFSLMRSADLVDVQVRVLAAADTKGVRAPIARHMVGYAREAGTLDGEFLDGLLAALERGIEDETYLLILPQFVVTGRV